MPPLGGLPPEPGQTQSKASRRLSQGHVRRTCLAPQGTSLGLQVPPSRLTVTGASQPKAHPQDNSEAIYSTRWPHATHESQEGGGG